MHNILFRELNDLFNVKSSNVLVNQRSQDFRIKLSTSSSTCVKIFPKALKFKIYHKITMRVLAIFEKQLVVEIANTSVNTTFFASNNKLKTLISIIFY